MILPRVELSHSFFMPSSKCVFLKHRKCKMENIWFALLGSGSHRLPLRWQGAQKTAVGRKSKRRERRDADQRPLQQELGGTLPHPRAAHPPPGAGLHGSRQRRTRGTLWDEQHTDTGACARSCWHRGPACPGPAWDTAMPVHRWESLAPGGWQPREATQPGPSDPEPALLTHHPLHQACARAVSRLLRPAPCQQLQALIPLEEPLPSPHHLNPPLRAATANNFCIYLLCRMEGDGLRGGGSWAVGGGLVQGAICLILLAPHPAGKWWPLLVTWLGGLLSELRALGGLDVAQSAGQELCYHGDQRHCPARLWSPFSLGHRGGPRCPWLFIKFCPGWTPPRAASEKATR